MGQNMALSNDPVPRDFWMNFPKCLRNPFGGLADYFEVPLHRATQHSVVKIFMKSSSSDKAIDRLSRIEHVP